MKEIISQFIADSPHKMISYADFIELALYHPEKGYYMKKREKIGKGGDFYTTSNVSDIFGRLIGKWFARNAGILGLQPSVCEIGAGNGRFASAFIQGWSEITNDILTYYIVEASPYHKSLQEQELSGLENVKITYANTFADSGMNQGLVFSNELFDAFPVHIIEKNKGMVNEVFIGFENDRFIEKIVPMENKKIIEFLKEQDMDLAEGQRIEIPLAMEPFIKSISENLSKGIMLTVDYGYTKEDWTHPARKKGSLRGYYQHQMHHDVLQSPGEMDITSHVHFDVLISQGEKYGLELLQKQRQDEFLMAIGILEELAEHQDPNPFSEASKRNRAIRSLIMPGSISQSFDVIIQGKRLDESAKKLLI
ncbi:SAM-dependent methyltransferase [Mesobacillus subterraneus]|uniref:class I SAM-dependent methyltransferase n=1 Tax=Mesobacillus subterraneus TaxID=285983 RepID=UPI0020410394|nr:SAM-dependent methyltransferase [Mesobacillus subterraneus]MCM3665557.1 SAM-dependent methyltransferase [Mesobacillus subterraneus]MCM3686262.1 SAM-dependent methyltransferase [Mesobacillus subterraneus]